MITMAAIPVSPLAISCTTSNGCSLIMQMGLPTGGFAYSSLLRAPHLQLGRLGRCLCGARMVSLAFLDSGARSGGQVDSRGVRL